MILERLETSDEGTFGRIPELGLFTGELPDRGNAPNISCVPAGTYECRFTFSPRFCRAMYLVLNVPGRSGIRVHPANFMGDKSKGKHSQLNGCIALGERLGWLDGQKAVLLSRPAISKLERVMDGKAFELEILPC